jgi:hypothetical protein
VGGGPPTSSFALHHFVCITLLYITYLHKKKIFSYTGVQRDGHSGSNPLFLFFWPPPIHSARPAADGGRTSPPMIVSSLLVFFRL